MQEYNFYKISIKKGNQVFTEPVYFRHLNGDVEEDQLVWRVEFELL